MACQESCFLFYLIRNQFVLCSARCYFLVINGFRSAVGMKLKLDKNNSVKYDFQHQNILYLFH